jgi:pimeloyl-ACP methyl ester carboxylesterase
VFDLEEYAIVIEEFIKELNLKNIILWWHSNGWAISIKIANRWKIKINRLILNNSAWIRNDKKRNLKRKILNYIVKYFSFLKKVFIFKKIRIIFYKIIGGQDYLNAEKNPYLKQTYLNMISSDLQNEIKNIKNHTLLIWWENDTYTPISDWLLMRKYIKNSKLIVLENEKHWIHLTSPDKLANTFLNNI